MKRITINVDDEVYRLIVHHQEESRAQSLAAAAVRLIVAGLASEGHKVTGSAVKRWGGNRQSNG